jgi:hypothetical protein
MSEDRLRLRPALLILGLAALIAWPIAGCGSSSERVEVSPEAQKKMENYLTNYQKQMHDQHKGKPATKKSR